MVAACPGLLLGFPPHWRAKLVQWGGLDGNAVSRPIWMFQWFAVRLQLISPLVYPVGVRHVWVGPLISHKGGCDPGRPTSRDFLRHSDPTAHLWALFRTPPRHAAMVWGWRWWQSKFVALQVNMRDLVVTGPLQGYFPDPTKIILVISQQNVKGKRHNSRGWEFEWLP